MKKQIALLLLGTLAAIGSGAGYQIHPFTADRPVHADNDRWRYFFELPRGIDITSDSSFRVDYDTSPNLAGLQGSLTVYLNSQPVDSLSLTNNTQNPGHWNVVLPKKYFKQGFNEIAIATRTRSTEGPCRDDDDLRNWVRFRSTSLMVVELPVLASYPLNAYPFPYVNWLSQTASSVPIVVPERMSDRTLSGALNLSAGLGMELSDKPLAVQLTHSVANSQTIHIGIGGELDNPQPKSAIEVRSTGLYVSGRTGDLLDAAVSTLGNPDVVAQMRGFASPAIDTIPKAQLPATRVGAVSFRELGDPVIKLAGVGTQNTSLVLHRPLLAQLGRGGQLRLQFRHSAVLLRTRSILTITMNDQPIGSAALTPENANDGELICPIPLDLADRNEWTIQISAHNELANADCSKNYEDVAWTTILGTSDFELRDGSLASTPYLDGFPYLRNRDGRLPDSLTVNIGTKPSNAVMTFAATAVARASQSNRGNSKWIAQLSGVTGYEDLLVGLYNDEDRFHLIAGRLLVAPRKDGVLTVRNDLAILPTTLEGGVVIQAVPKPSGGVSYVVLGASDDAIARFTEYLSSLQGAGALHGQVAVFTKDGQLFTFEPTTTGDRLAAEEAELHRYKPGMTLFMSIALGLLAILAIFIGSKFIKRKKPKA